MAQKALEDWGLRCQKAQAPSGPMPRGLRSAPGRSMTLSYLGDALQDCTKAGRTLHFSSSIRKWGPTIGLQFPSDTNSLG